MTGFIWGGSVRRKYHPKVVLISFSERSRRSDRFGVALSPVAARRLPKIHFISTHLAFSIHFTFFSYKNHLSPILQFHSYNYYRIAYTNGPLPFPSNDPESARARDVDHAITAVRGRYERPQHPYRQQCRLTVLPTSRCCENRECVYSYRCHLLFYLRANSMDYRFPTLWLARRFSKCSVVMLGSPRTGPFIS